MREIRYFLFIIISKLFQPLYVFAFISFCHIFVTVTKSELSGFLPNFRPERDDFLNLEVP